MVQTISVRCLLHWHSKLVDKLIVDTLHRSHYLMISRFGTRNKTFWIKKQSYIILIYYYFSFIAQCQDKCNLKPSAEPEQSAMQCSALLHVLHLFHFNIAPLHSLCHDVDGYFNYTSTFMTLVINLDKLIIMHKEDE